MTVATLNMPEEKRDQKEDLTRDEIIPSLKPTSQLNYSAAILASKQEAERLKEKLRNKKEELADSSRKEI